MEFSVHLGGQSRAHVNKIVVERFKINFGSEIVVLLPKFIFILIDFYSFQLENLSGTGSFTVF